MNTVIKWTNRIILFTAFALVYWVFVAIVVGVFGFKVFRENTTELFFASIFGLLAVMMGAAIANITANLTKISQAVSKDTSSHSYQSVSTSGRFFILAVLASFPLLFAGLYAGDQYTSHMRERIIVAAAKSLVDENKDVLQAMVHPKIERSYINKTAKALGVLSRFEKKFPSVSLLFEDQFDNKKIYLLIDQNDDNYSTKFDPNFKQYIFSTSVDERNYLADVFAGKNEKYRFSAHDGRYELYYPVKMDNDVFVLYLTQYSEYGKSGS